MENFTKVDEFRHTKLYPRETPVQLEESTKELSHNQTNINLVDEFSYLRLEVLYGIRRTKLLSVYTGSPRETRVQLEESTNGIQRTISRKVTT